MKELYREYKENIKILILNIRRFAKYQIATKIILSIILLPFFYFIAGALMRSRGYAYLTNGLIQKFLLSPQGVILIITGLVFGLLVILIELGGLLVISYQSILGYKESSFRSVLKYCVGKIKYLFGIDGIFIVLYLFLIAPFMDNELKTSVLESLKIPGFIMDVINSKLLYQVYLFIIVIIFIVLSVRWMFSLNILVQNNKKVKRPLRESSRLVKKNFWYILKYSFFMELFNILVFLIGAVIYLFLSIIIILLLQSISEVIVFYMIMGIGIVIFAAILFLMTPFRTIVLTKMYLHVSEGKGEELTLAYKSKDNLIDKLIRNKFVLGAVLIGSIIFSSVYMYIVIDEMENIKYSVNITAHRGSSTDAPENTLAAIKSAFENGANYAEIDVQQTKDGKLVLLHDKSFKRTTGVDKNVWELTLSEIKELDAGSWFHEKFKGEKVPTLEEVIDYSKGKISLNIEIKTNPADTTLIEDVVSLIREKDLIDKCVVTSLDYNAVEEVERLESRIKTGYIMFIALGDLEKLNVDFYSVEETNVNDDFITNAHMIGREVHVWTINSTESMEKVLEYGVDNIITDNVKSLRDLIDKKTEEKGLGIKSR
ncbi:glycerophosphodiester phosphodiesterase [Oceanirhabdus sp. W0125-5]|uniref:glycerophosphodiester phosphodiesterase n=1 Tax=Oceanirhabdus sp. W0125-5 TaxID=2999116 RepID=UPI0022F2F130|nr:glycerophosphodiester phosphodiesterase [Oceanirhabdus sp. W0125-5]WBW96280.1 glycerophosphodiester phosphodiesterase [Oceanirhabdus sp. W0125-5]